MKRVVSQASFGFLFTLSCRGRDNHFRGGQGQHSQANGLLGWLDGGWLQMGTRQLIGLPTLGIFMA